MATSHDPRDTAPPRAAFPLAALSLTALLLTILAACGSPGSASATPTPTRAPLLVGGDISALARLEQGGAVFRDGDAPKDAIAAMMAHGSNAFRLRLFVSPDGSEVQVNDLPYTIALAKRIRAAGATLMLDIHYSDTWADPQHQITPAAWQALDIDGLETRVEEYTVEVITAMKSAGVLPVIIGVGNEIDGGLLWPLGHLVRGASDSLAQQERLGRLLRAGVRGVRRATAPADSVRVMIHYSQGATAARARWFFDIITAQRVPFDIIGISYYPSWHGTLSSLRESLRETSAWYGKDIMVVETAYPWRAGWTPEGTSPEAMNWPLTIAGQAAFLRDVVDAVAAVPDGRGTGVFWWYPEAIRVPGLPIWGNGALALFDDAGRILPAVSAFQRVPPGGR